MPEPLKSERDDVEASLRSLSYWHDSVPDDLSPRAPLDGDSECDVAIIGGGLTGLWTAYYLSQRDPLLSITIIEKEVVGFGASGRNGGWCSALFPASTASLERRHGREAAIAMRRAMIATVSEVGRVVNAEHIDCDFVHGGTIAFARSAVQLRAAKADVAEAKSFGVDALRLLSSEGLGASRALGASFDPACARLHPAKLVRGLARVLERRGVRIVEQTAAIDYSAGEVRTDRGTVRCETIVLAVEGYGAQLAATHRSVLPLYSLMVATTPLSDEQWNALGIEHGQTFTDYRHLLIYGQRTADNRIAFGGRGARYHFGSAIHSSFDRVPAVFEHLTASIADLFPSLGEIEISHRWGGPLGVPRDWHASVTFDADSRIGAAGGYVGDGLSTTNLAGRTLATLITGERDELTALPWVSHRSRRWEPEPLRFLGANLGMLAMRLADGEEQLTGKRSLIARAVAPLLGH